ncbi:MAG: 50S ribosomal protein L18 [Mycoplasmataceae bacterium]|jgi:large subunit ribosomal protein L18|nr:50S ribosomal protein L18 [Mycoplasmataceae bacterium]
MKKVNINRRDKRDLRHKRITNKLKKIHNEKHRLVVTKTNANIFAQIVDDKTQTTVVAVSTLMIKKPGNIQSATEVGQLLAKAALEKNIAEVVFDRGGHKYHGQIKALADGAREGGLKL